MNGSLVHLKIEPSSFASCKVVFTANWAISIIRDIELIVFLISFKSGWTTPQTFMPWHANTSLKNLKNSKFYTKFQNWKYLQGKNLNIYFKKFNTISNIQINKV